MKNLTVLFYATLACFYLGTLTLNATTRYVTQTGTGGGTSWADASSNLHGIINASAAGDSIWVATGVYKPTRDPFGSSNPADPRDKTFYIKDGIKIYGGFAGTETNLNQRNILANPTTLSGDIGVANDNTDNSYHVVLASASSTNGIGVTIDGFTIRGGNANNIGNFIYLNGNQIYCTYGSGIFINYGINTLMNNTVSENTGNGSGIYTHYGTNRLTNNIVSGNTTYSNGGGIYTAYGMNILTNNTVFGNTGSGIYNENGTNTLINNIVSGNTTYGNGGGVRIYGGVNKLINNILSGNTADYYGGGIYIEFGTNTLTNNTLSGNTAYYGGGIYTYGGTNTLTNNIFWGNKIDDNPTIAGADYYAYSTNGNTFKNNLLQLASSNYPLNTSLPYGISAGATGNVFAQDPLFVNATDIDGADNIHRTADDGLRLSFGSAAYNTGNALNAPVTDIIGTARPQFGVMDIGAYESTTNLAASAPTISIGNIVNATCNTGGSMKVNISGGTTPYVQLWSNGATTATISNLSAGTYTVTVTDANGYTATSSANIIDQVIAVPTGLTTTNITATSATFNWNAVAGAANYTIQGRKVGTATWTTIGPVTATFKNISSQIACGKTYEWKVRANCANGASSAFSAVTTFTTAACVAKTDNTVITPTFSLQPNPANSLVTLNYFTDTNTPLTIKVMDMTGRIVLQQNTTITEGDNSIDLPTNNLPQGYYVVEANDGTTQSYQKLLIVR